MPSATATCRTWRSSSNRGDAPPDPGWHGPTIRQRRPPGLLGSLLRVRPAFLRMSRFSKSAAFPILIVVILAFFASQLISGPNQKKDPGFGAFTEELNAGKLKTVEMRNRTNEQIGRASCRE